jgi:very-short-patch-repair endonuclease
MVYLGKSVEREMHFGAKPELFKYAQEMRKNPTESEKVLWNTLRRFRSEGYIFRRQHPLDIFIADFYCHKLKLIIEVDGEIHDSEQAIEYDDGRSGELEKFGIKVIRFTNDQVLGDKETVISLIHQYISETASPSPPGEGDRGGEASIKGRGVPRG